MPPASGGTPSVPGAPELKSHAFRLANTGVGLAATATLSGLLALCLGGALLWSGITGFRNRVGRHGA